MLATAFVLEVLKDLHLHPVSLVESVALVQLEVRRGFRHCEVGIVTRFTLVEAVVELRNVFFHVLKDGRIVVLQDAARLPQAVLNLGRTRPIHVGVV